MNSFNHYAYGAIGDWMYSVMAGIDVDPADPGFKHVFIRPQPGGGFTSASATHETLYGTVGSSWTVEKRGVNGADEVFTLNVEVPPNVVATVRLPISAIHQMTEGGRALAPGNGIISVRQDKDAVLVTVGSGRYQFAGLRPQLAD